MADTTTGKVEAQSVGADPQLIPAEGFPPHGLPTIFADAIANLAPSASTARFYLLRTEPEVGGSNSYKNVPVAQIILPMDGFIGMVLFLDQALERLIKNGAEKRLTR